MTTTSHSFIIGPRCGSDPGDYPQANYIFQAIARVMDEDQDSAFPACNSAFPACNSAVPACNSAVGVPAVSRSTDHSQTDLAVVWRVGKCVEHVPVFFPVPTSARLCVRACADAVGNHRAAGLHPRQLACLES